MVLSRVDRCNYQRPYAGAGSQDRIGRGAVSDFAVRLERLFLRIGHRAALCLSMHLPKTLAGYLIGKSSWGRQGLVIATAIGIHAWYRGVIVLELANVGEVPLLLYPGMRIAHLFFYETKELDISMANISGYIGSTRPDIGRITLDPEIRLIGLRERM